MVSVVKRRRGGREYYYLYHDSKRGVRRQYESYLGSRIPPDIDERKKRFALEIERSVWAPKLKRIRTNYRKERSKLPRSVREKNLRAFSVRFTYNTQRIEGSTMTLRDTALLLEDGLSPRNRPIGDVREAEAHQRIFLEAMNQRKDLTQSVVTGWNKELLKDTRPDIAGMVRSYDVRIGQSRFVPPAHTAVRPLMRGFFRWYRANKKLDPVELAALAHLKFVTIHPFGDGNGRVTRLMMNSILNSADCPLLDISYSDRRSYYNALERSQVRDDELPFLKWFVSRYLAENKKYL